MVNKGIVITALVGMVIILGGCQSSEQESLIAPDKISCMQAVQYYKDGDMDSLTEQLRWYGWGLSYSENQRELSLIFYEKETEEEQIAFMNDVAKAAALTCVDADPSEDYIDAAGDEMKRLSHIRDIKEGFTPIPLYVTNSFQTPRVFERRPLSCSEALSVPVTKMKGRYWNDIVTALDKLTVDDDYGMPRRSVLDYATKNKKDMGRLITQLYLSYEACKKGVSVGMNVKHIDVLLGVIQDDIGNFTLNGLYGDEFIKELSLLENRKKSPEYNNPLQLYVTSKSNKEGAPKPPLKVVENPEKLLSSVKTRVVATKVRDGIDYYELDNGYEIAKSDVIPLKLLLDRYVKPSDHTAFLEVILKHGYIYEEGKRIWRVGTNATNSDALVSQEVWIRNGKVESFWVLRRGGTPKINGLSVTFLSGKSMYKKDVQRFSPNITTGSEQLELLPIRMDASDDVMINVITQDGANYRIRGDFYEQGHIEAGAIIKLVSVRELISMMKS